MYIYIRIYMFNIFVCCSVLVTTANYFLIDFSNSEETQRGTGMQSKNGFIQLLISRGVAVSSKVIDKLCISFAARIIL
jgi:hypothetical protein